MPIPPYDHPLNTTMQTVATVVLWSATALILGIAVRRAMRERTAFPVVVVLAVAVGSLIEPLYDIAYHLLWYVLGQWTLFTAFGLPQPVWVMPAYVVVFAGPTLYLYPKFERGVFRVDIFKYAGLTFVTTAVFEIAAINLGLYTYYGPHPFRLFDYPLWISVMEAAQITGFAVVATVFKQRSAGGLSVLGLFVLYPAHFAYALLGAGFPALIAINMDAPSTALVWATGVVSMGFAAVALLLVSDLLVRDSAPMHPVRTLSAPAT
jgi:hypothetical protein